MMTRGVFTLCDVGSSNSPIRKMIYDQDALMHFLSHLRNFAGRVNHNFSLSASDSLVLSFHFLLHASLPDSWMYLTKVDFWQGFHNSIFAYHQSTLSVCSVQFKAHSLNCYSKQTSLFSVHLFISIYITPCYCSVNASANLGYFLITKTNFA